MPERRPTESRKPSEKKPLSEKERNIREHLTSVGRKRGRLVNAFRDFMKLEQKLDSMKERTRKQFEQKYSFPEGREGEKIVSHEVENSPTVCALKEMLERKKSELGRLAEEYDCTVMAWTAAEYGKPYASLDEQQKKEVDKQRITFEGTVRELTRKALEHEKLSLRTVSLPKFGKTLSFRLGILGRDKRDELFRTAIREAIKALPSRLSPLELELKKREIEEKLRQPDRYLIAREFGSSWATYRRYLRIPGLREEVKKVLEDIKKSQTMKDYEYNESLLTQLFNFYRRRLVQLASLMKNSRTVREENRNELTSLTRDAHHVFSTARKRIETKEKK